MRIKAYRVIQMVILSSVLLCAFMPVKAQIYFKNPSFESSPTGPFVPDSWKLYEVLVGTAPDKRYNYLDYFNAFDGLTYIIMGQAAPFDTLKEGFYQTLSCYLNKNIEYNFSFFATALEDLENPHFCRRGGGLSVWLADDSLNKVQLIFRVCSIDTNNWAKIDVRFKPSHQSNTIIFESYQTCNNDCGYPHPIGIDYLSPITFSSNSYIKTTVGETSLNEYKPVRLNCSVLNDSNATYTWVSEPPGFYSTDSSPTAFPKENTRYIVTAHFSCGMDVSDTVAVTIGGTISHPPLNLKLDSSARYITQRNKGGGIPPPYVQTIILNNESWHIQNENTPISVKLYTALGQLLYTDTNYQNNYNPAHEGLAPGVYFYVINYNGGNEVRGKVLVVRL